MAWTGVGRGVGRGVARGVWRRVWRGVAATVSCQPPACSHASSCTERTPCNDAVFADHAVCTHVSLPPALPVCVCLFTFAVCHGTPGASLSNGRFPPTCASTSAGNSCAGVCDPGYSGNPQVACQPDPQSPSGASWVFTASGSCIQGGGWWWQSLGLCCLRCNFISCLGGQIMTGPVTCFSSLMVCAAQV